MSDRISTPTAAAIPERFRAAFGDWTPSAVVFDCDGMLLDTETVWQRTQDAAVAELAAELTDADEQELHGSTIEVAAEIIAERATRGALDAEAVYALLRREFDRELDGAIRPMPGALQAVRACAAQVPLGCASNSWLEALEHKLTVGGLRESFQVLAASDTVEHPKPAPDMYVQAARALGAEPQDALAFEDSGTGAQAARDGGLRLVAIPAGGKPAPAADITLGSLEDPELLAWIATW